MPTWPDLDASLDCDAGWRQRFLEADALGRCRPVARPVFHSVAGAVFGPDGALARLASGAVVAVYLQAGGTGLVLARRDRGGAQSDLGGGDGGGGRGGDHADDRGDGDVGDGDLGGDGGPATFTAALIPAGRPRPATAAELWAALADAPRQLIGADPGAWPAATCRC